MDNPSDEERRAAATAVAKVMGYEFVGDDILDSDNSRVRLFVAAAEAALIAAAQVRAKTHVSVPSEPTLDMKYEGMEAADCDIGLVAVGNVYRAMLSASGGNRD